MEDWIRLLLDEMFRLCESFVIHPHLKAKSTILNLNGFDLVILAQIEAIHVVVLF